MKSKQTAIEWLENILHDFIHPEHGAEFFPFIEKAKAMEKEQIENAYLEGMINGWNFCEKEKKKKKFDIIHSSEYYKNNYE
jgi:hypothetical protein